jgi:hypothetical protein
MIVRSKRRDRFVVIGNETIRDRRLSYKARGILAYLLSLPDNWSISSQYLATVAPDGRDGVRTGLQELERYGYLVRERIQNQETGRWGWYQVVYDRPHGNDGDIPSNSSCGNDGDDPLNLSTTEDGLSDVGKSGFLRKTDKEETKERISTVSHYLEHLCTACSGNGYSLVGVDEVERCPFCDGDGTR